MTNNIEKKKNIHTLKQFYFLIKKLITILNKICIIKFIVYRLNVLDSLHWFHLYYYEKSTYLYLIKFNIHYIWNNSNIK